MWDSEIPLQGQYSLSKTRLLVKFHYPTLVRINGSINLIYTFFWGGGVSFKTLRYLFFYCQHPIRFFRIFTQSTFLNTRKNDLTYIVYEKFNLENIRLQQR